MTKKSTENAALNLVITIVSILGLLLCVSGIVFAFVGEGSASIVPGALALLSGLIVFAMGKQRLGGITAILGMAVILFGLAASQGVIPGFQQTDHEYPDDIPLQQSGE